MQCSFCATRRCKHLYVVEIMEWLQHIAELKNNKMIEKQKKKHFKEILYFAREFHFGKHTVSLISSSKCSLYVLKETESILNGGN